MMVMQLDTHIVVQFFLLLLNQTNKAFFFLVITVSEKQQVFNQEVDMLTLLYENQAKKRSGFHPYEHSFCRP